MNIVTVRRISQSFFLVLFLWFCIASSWGVAWWQLRGWPVNWFLQLDPLVALATMLTTGTLYAGLPWALVTVVLTALLGRFFCGWVCPFGTMHQVVGYLGRRGKPLPDRAAANRYHGGQVVKYYLLVFLLSAAAGTLIAQGVRAAFDVSAILWLLAIATAVSITLNFMGYSVKKRKTAGLLLLLLGFWTFLALVSSMGRMIGASLQTGLLDPIPLVHRSVNLVLLPLVDANSQLLSTTQRYYEGAWLIGLLFLTAILLNLKSPRFYCRYVCPLGALYGVMGRFALWRIGKATNECTQCKLCEANCEGACEPTNQIRTAECVLCVNCLHDCKHGLIGFRTTPSAAGEIASPDLSRRGFVVTLASGIAIIPIMRLGGYTQQNWNPALIRPPGALPEPDFLSRCIKCGQCMRICPTNIIQPAELQGGLEAVWTPALNFRIGSSGCQLNCIACSHVCPTAAIRPISLDEKLGRGEFTELGPIRLGTAFVDLGRCLPWAMDKPCIVCQENCPVSPKAIHVKEHFNTVREGVLQVYRADATTLEIADLKLLPGAYSSGDYFIRAALESESQRRLIVENTDRLLRIAPQAPFEKTPATGSIIEIQVRLQRPQVDPARCIGCGVCEHECPVSGRRGIRITAENESRSKSRSLLLEARRYEAMKTLKV